MSALNCLDLLGDRHQGSSKSARKTHDIFTTNSCKKKAQPLILHSSSRLICWAFYVKPILGGSSHRSRECVAIATRCHTYAYSRAQKREFLLWRNCPFSAELVCGLMRRGMNHETVICKSLSIRSFHNSVSSRDA